MTPDTRLVFVSSPEQIDELDKVSDSVLSLQAAANKVSGNFPLDRHPNILIIAHFY